MENKDHLTIKGINDIRVIKENMNTGRLDDQLFDFSNEKHLNYMNNVLICSFFKKVFQFIY